MPRKKLAGLSSGLPLKDEQLIHFNGGFENAQGFINEDLAFAINDGVCENTSCTNTSRHCSDDINHAPCTNTGC